jgi:hypothetical protein
MTISPPRSPVPAGSNEPTGESGWAHPALSDRALANQVTTALISYLEAVARALNRWGVAVAGVEITPTAVGPFGGRIQLARQRRSGGGPQAAVELRWSETTGWEVGLRPTRKDVARPWRFLHAELTPHPDQVASFTDGLLRGQDLGMTYPAHFRAPGDNVATLAGQLARAAHRTSRR